MPNIFVEELKRGGYRALRGGQRICGGLTQNACALEAQSQFPDDPILAARVENTRYGNRDHWRRIYPRKKS